MQTLRTAARVAVGALAVAALPAVASAQITVFNSQAAFLAAVSSPGLDTFNDLPGTSVPSPLNRTAGAYTYRASVIPNGGSGNFFPAGTTTDRWLSTDSALEGFRFDTFSASVRGVGGNFFLSDIAGAFVPTGQITIVATAGTFTSTQTLTNATTTTFLGFVSTVPFTSITVNAVQPTTGAVWATANDLRLGAAAPTSTVPEPSTYALFATGLVGLAIAARRRK